jgi:hypothetical protein
MKYILRKCRQIEPNLVTLLLAYLFVMYVLKPLLFDKGGLLEPFGTFYPLPYAMHKPKEDYYPKDSNLLFSNNKCCKSCCKQLWPVPFDVNDCPTCENNKEKYVLSNYTCQGENGSGCVCVNKSEGDFLDGRGDNKLMMPDTTFPHDGVEPTPATSETEEEIVGVEGETVETFESF